jgi:hypothetical protein
VDEESHDRRTVELEEGLDGSSQGAFVLSRNMVKDEVVDDTSSIKPTTINGIYNSQPSSSPPPGPLSTLLVARIQAGTSATYPVASCRSKQELIEQPIHTSVTIQPDSTRYTGMYNHSGSILPTNPGPHHFQPSSPQLCQEDGEIGEILDTLCVCHLHRRHRHYQRPLLL